MNYGRKRKLMGKIYKTFHCNNTKLKETEGWPTTDKRGTVCINDWKNNFAFYINFGKKPRIRIWKTKKNGDFIGNPIADSNKK